MEMQTQAHLKEQRSHRYGCLQLSLLSGLMFNLVMLYTTPAFASPAEPIQSATETAVSDANLSLDTPDTARINQIADNWSKTTILPDAEPTPAEPALVSQSPETTTANSFTLPTEASPSAENISKQAQDLVVQETQQSPQPSTPEPSESPTPAEPATSSTINNPLLPSNQWKFDFEPYLFVPFVLNGDIFFGRGRRELFPNRPGEILSGSGINVSVDKNLDNFFSKLTNIFGVSGRLQAWKGNFGLVADGLYVSVGLNSTGGGRELTLRDRFNVTVPGINVDTQTELASFSLAASYRLVTVPLRTVSDPSNPSNYYPAVSFEGYAGARYVSLNQDIDLDPGPTYSFSGSEVNPMLGGVAKLMLSPTFAFYFRGDTSNLGGGNLKQFYNLIAGIDWKFSGSFALRLAYRFTQIEFVKEGRLNGDNGLNLRAQGVQLGISWQF